MTYTMSLVGFLFTLDEHARECHSCNIRALAWYFAWDTWIVVMMSWSWERLSFSTSFAQYHAPLILLDCKFLKVENCFLFQFANLLEFLTKKLGSGNFLMVFANSHMLFIDTLLHLSWIFPMDWRRFLQTSIFLIWMTVSFLSLLRYCRFLGLEYYSSTNILLIFSIHLNLILYKMNFAGFPCVISLISFQ